MAVLPDRDGFFSCRGVLGSKAYMAMCARDEICLLKFTENGILSALGDPGSKDNSTAQSAVSIT